MKKLKEVKTLESRSVLEALVFQVVYILTAEQHKKNQSLLYCSFLFSLLNVLYK